MPQDDVCCCHPKHNKTRHSANRKEFLGLYLSPTTSTRCGLVTIYGDIDLGQHCPRLWFVVWRHQAITWIDTNISSKMPCGIYLRRYYHKKISWTYPVTYFGGNNSKRLQYLRVSIELNAQWTLSLQFNKSGCDRRPTMTMFTQPKLPKP